jgi:hypothetical protein
MSDNGLFGGDVTAGDGIYSSSFLATEAGTYSVEVYFDTDQDTMRTTFQTFHVVEDSVSLKGNAFAYPVYAFGAEKSQADPTAIRIALDVDYTMTSLKASTSKIGEYRVYAEVWGTDSTGEEVAVAWSSGLVDVIKLNSEEHRGKRMDVLTLDVATEWFSLADVCPQTGNLRLNNVRVQSTEEGWSPVVLDADNIVVTSKGCSLNPDVAKYDVAVHGITEQMRQGPRPQWLEQRNELRLARKEQMFMATGSNDSSIDTLLVHGYCSGEIPFPLAEFTNSYGFADFSQSRSNDVFAQLIIDYVEEQDLVDFGIVCHSQGGLASLQLHTYYWSDLDNFQGDRFIQSICTPWEGCGAAGLLATLGDLLNAGCGANDDLTIEGAALWLSAVPYEMREDVYFYYTTYPENADIMGKL